MEIIDGSLELDIPSGANALEVLQAIYRSSDMPLHTRMRAAIAAIPFESPKLAVLATVGADDFGAMLDRAVARSRRVIDVKPIPKEPKPAPPPTDVRLVPTIYDRRYRRI
jgi:hypothetical protein